MRFFLLILVVFFAGPVWAQDGGLPKPPDATATFEVAVADFVAGTRLEGLSGVAQVSMASRAEDAVSTTMEISCDTLRAGSVVIGSMRGDGAPDEALARLYDLRGAMQPIRFGRNATQVPAAEQQRLVAVAEVVRLLGPGVELTVNGYSDAKGTDATKLRVSRARANAVRTALIRAGVPRNIITVVAKGDTERIDTTDSPEAEAGNRRVELELRLTEEAAGK